MSISTNLQTDTSLRGQEILGSSLTRLAAKSAKLGAFDAINVSGKLDTQRQGAQAALDDVQGAVSAAQAQDGLLGQASGILGQMSQLVEDAGQDTANPTLQQQFEALQDQLQDATGSADSNGGSRSASALAALVAKDDAGAYQLKLSSAGTSEAVDNTAAAVTDERSALGETLTRLARQAAGLQIEFSNLNASMPGLNGSDDAAAATQWAKYALSSQPGTAQAAQSAGRAPQAAFKLLED